MKIFFSSNLPNVLVAGQYSRKFTGHKFCLILNVIQQDRSERKFDVENKQISGKFGQMLQKKAKAAANPQTGANIFTGAIFSVLSNFSVWAIFSVWTKFSILVNILRSVNSTLDSR